MFQTTKHKAPALLALFLSAVLFGSILVKPLHVLLVSHDIAEVVDVPSDLGLLSSPHHHDCSICQFEFCSFIPQVQVNVPPMAVTFAKELAPETTDCLSNRTSLHFQLRAPPVL